MGYDALVEHRSWGEIKGMYVARGARGQGRYSYLRASSITLPSLGSVAGAARGTWAL